MASDHDVSGAQDAAATQAPGAAAAGDAETTPAGQAPATPAGGSGHAPTPTGAAPARPRRGAKRGSRIGVTLTAIGVGCLIVGFGGGLLGSRVLPSTASGSCDAEHIAGDVLPSIVTINLAGGGVGSGEVIDAKGDIITNNHVVAPDGRTPAAGSISVLFSDGARVPASLVGRDPKSDIAVVKVDTTQKLPVIGIGDSEDVRVGQPVVALGAPLGLSSSVTAGIVSALGRNVPVPGDGAAPTILAGAIQTDAAINPGNSGGALVNCAGDLVGVNSAIATVPNATGVSGGGSVGIGFAVPSNLAMQVADQLIKTGEVDYPTFGVQVAPIPPAVAQAFGVDDGLYVQSVTPGGPADQAGIKEGDVVTHIDGQPATSSDVLITVTRTKRPGDTITVTYVRDGAPYTVKVTLGSSR